MNKAERIKAFISEFLDVVKLQMPTLIENVEGSPCFAVTLQANLNKLSVKSDIVAIVFDNSEYQFNLDRVNAFLKGTEDNLLSADIHFALKVHTDNPMSDYIVDSYGNVIGDNRSLNRFHDIIVVPTHKIMQAFENQKLCRVVSANDSKVMNLILAGISHYLPIWEPG